MVKKIIWEVHNGVENYSGPILVLAPKMVKIQMIIFVCFKPHYAKSGYPF